MNIWPPDKKMTCLTSKTGQDPKKTGPNEKKKKFDESWLYRQKSGLIQKNFVEVSNYLVLYYENLEEFRKMSTEKYKNSLSIYNIMQKSKIVYQ